MWYKAKAKIWWLKVRNSKKFNQKKGNNRVLFGLKTWKKNYSSLDNIFPLNRQTIILALKKNHKHISKHKILGGLIFTTRWHKSITKILNSVLCKIYEFFYYFITFYWKLFSDCCDKFDCSGSIIYLSCLSWFWQING